MAVYVDDFGCRAQVGGLNAKWSHLIADSRDELHEFARQLGLKRSWFQDPVVNGKPRARAGSRAAENWHYDVTESKRQLALKLGAQAISWRDLTKVIEARIVADRDGSNTETETHDWWVVSDRVGNEIARVPGAGYREAQAAAQKIERVRDAVRRDGGMYLRRLTVAESAADDGRV